MEKMKVSKTRAFKVSTATESARVGRGQNIIETIVAM